MRKDEFSYYSRISILIDIEEYLDDIGKQKISSLTVKEFDDLSFLQNIRNLIYQELPINRDQLDRSINIMVKYYKSQYEKPSLGWIASIHD